MYEPVWYASKTLTAAAEATAGVLAVLGYTRLSRRQDHRQVAPSR
ncbi:hypothetical protein [Arthrobacter sp. Br18]|nr:hypothetical protein [Arthrobacter sp. Br18]